jgi:hypothetical protein
VAGILQANLEVKMRHLRPAYEKQTITASCRSTGRFVPLAFGQGLVVIGEGGAGEGRQVTHKGHEMRGSGRQMQLPQTPFVTPATIRWKLTASLPLSRIVCCVYFRITPLMQ